MGASAISHADPLLLEWLADHGVEYEVHEHVEAFTALDVARAEGVDPHTFAKVVVVRAADGRTAFLVLETTDQLDLHKAAHTLGAESVRLLTETSSRRSLRPVSSVRSRPSDRSSRCPTIADYALHDDRDISFNAGSHRCSIRVERAGWERATGVVYADLAAGRRPSGVGAPMTAPHDPSVPLPRLDTGPDPRLDRRARSLIARWHVGDVQLERLRSDVPPHRRTTRHVRYDPAVAHGGGAPEDVGEAKRLAHLAHFVTLVADRIRPTTTSSSSVPGLCGSASSTTCAKTIGTPRGREW